MLTCRQWALFSFILFLFCFPCQHRSDPERSRTTWGYMFDLTITLNQCFPFTVFFLIRWQGLTNSARWFKTRWWLWTVINFPKRCCTRTFNIDVHTPRLYDCYTVRFCDDRTMLRANSKRTAASRSSAVQIQPTGATIKIGCINYFRRFARISFALRTIWEHCKTFIIKSFQRCFAWPLDMIIAHAFLPEKWM